ncbi:hypothetical protein AcW1_001197 [Taiwanofungus camphoratus]|nr:hypothetical protein AcW1_001197 [Antrodia cinnamomea]
MIYRIFITRSRKWCYSIRDFLSDLSPPSFRLMPFHVNVTLLQHLCFAHDPPFSVRQSVYRPKAASLSHRCPPYPLHLGSAEIRYSFVACRDVLTRSCGCLLLMQV